MSVKAVLFDLDGTVMDSGPGIKHSAIATLKEMHLPAPSYEDLNYFIGPPLRDCFRLSHVSEERVEEAVKIYRKNYEKEKGGYLDANPYPGMIEMLSSLKKKGYLSFVCTSKGEALAKRIVHAFSLDTLFAGVYGSTLDGKISKKKDIISLCLSSLSSGSKAVMIGDTYLDIVGANENHIPGIGVTWGYGEKSRMKEVGAVALVDNTEECEEKIEEVLD